VTWPDNQSSATALLSSNGDVKTLSIHGLSYEIAERHPRLGYVLTTEKSFECIEYLLEGIWLSGCYDSMHLVLEAFNRSCDTFPKPVVGLRIFQDYNPGKASLSNLFPARHTWVGI